MNLSRSTIVHLDRAAYVPGMDSNSITRAQAEQMKEVVGRQLRYLGKLQRRMEKMRWPPTDPLYVDVCAAFDKIHKLNVALHYLSCDPGSVGRS